MQLQSPNGESIELDEGEVPTLVEALSQESPPLEGGEAAARKLEAGETDLTDEELEAVRVALATRPSKRN